MSAELDKQEIDTTFRFHHVCWIVSDMDRAIYLWRDVLGFTLLSDSPSPTADDGTNMWPGGMEEMDDITDMENYRFRAVCLRHGADGASIELHQPINPPVKKTPKEFQDYSYTGVQEVAIWVPDIDTMYKKVCEAGYVPTTDKPWSMYDNLNFTFLFYTEDGDRIQLWSGGRYLQTWSGDWHF